MSALDFASARAILHQRRCQLIARTVAIDAVFTRGDKFVSLANGRHHALLLHLMSQSILGHHAPLLRLLTGRARHGNIAFSILARLNSLLDRAGRIGGGDGGLGSILKLLP